MVAQTFTLGSASDQTGNVNNLKNGGDLGFWFPHFAELDESLIWDGNNGLVGFDSTEGVVFGRDIELGKDIVSGGFTDVGETNDTHFEGVGGTTPEDFEFGSLFFFWWHVYVNNV
jgi:hypothetical protein